MAKSILVTGASKGLGAAITGKLLARGHQVIGIARHSDGLTQFSGHQHFIPVCGDVCEAFTLESAMKSVHTNGLDGMILNAGDTAPISRVEHLDIKEYRRMIETSLISPSAWIKAMLPALRESRGRIIYTGSSAVKTPLPAWGAFTSIRGGMHHLLASLAKEEPKITCMVVEPGIMDTETLHRVLGRVREEMPPGQAKWFESVKALDPSQPADAFVKLILSAPSSKSAGCCESFRACPFGLFLGDTAYRYICDTCFGFADDEDEDEYGKQQLLRLSMGWREIGEVLRRHFPQARTIAELSDLLAEHWPRFFASDANGAVWRSLFSVAMEEKNGASSKKVVEAVVSAEGLLIPVATSCTNFGTRSRLSRQIEKHVVDDEKDDDEEIESAAMMPKLSEGAAESLGFKSSKALNRSLKKLASTFVFSNLDFDRPNPEGPLAISTAPTHTAQQLKIEGMHVSIGVGEGYAMARTTHGFDSGSWYFEVSLPEKMPKDGHVRLGLAQILAEAQAPVGYDEYSYAIRDRDGAFVHCGRATPYASAFGPGDRVGVLLRLPSEAPTDEQALKEWEAAYPPKHLGTYKVKQEILASPGGSDIRFFLNGRDCGPALRAIYKAKYYPSVSLYNGAIVSFNFGPEFQFPLPSGARPACDIDHIDT